jgi:hypothetical protein
VTDRPLVSRTTLLMLLALTGLLIAWQTRLIVGRYGQPTYFLLIGLVVLGLAALARPRPK